MYPSLTLSPRSPSTLSAVTAGTDRLVGVRRRVLATDIYVRPPSYIRRGDGRFHECGTINRTPPYSGRHRQQQQGQRWPYCQDPIKGVRGRLGPKPTFHFQ